MEGAAAAAESLKSQAAELAEAFSVFKLDTVARPARGVAPVLALTGTGRAPAPALRAA